MKLFLLSLFFLSVIIGCGGKSKKDLDLIEEGQIFASEILDTCLCDELAKDSSNIFYQNDSLFTGICVYNYPNSTEKYMVKSMLLGKLHGNVTYFDKQGAVLLVETYENGEKKRTGDGAPLVCDCSELKVKNDHGTSIHRAYLDEIPFEGKCKKKYPDSDQIYMEVSYKNGLHDGYTIFYDKEGNTMYMEKYENGELLKVLHDAAE